MEEKPQGVKAYETLVDAICHNLKRDVPKYFKTAVKTVTHTVTHYVCPKRIEDDEDTPTKH
jgi:hypothetical protein